MSNAILRILFIFCVAHLAYGANIDINPDRRGWHIELKRLAANISSTSISNQSSYESFSDSRISGNSQFIAQGFFDSAFSYYAARYVIFNTGTIDYGRTIIANNGTSVSNTTLDRILLSSDYTHRIWYVPSFAGGFEIGPYARANYQSSFENPRHIVRVNGGMKFFDGTYIKDLYINAFGEKDFAIATAQESYGWEGGIRLQYSFNENFSKLEYYTNFRHYLHSSAPQDYNPLYQLEIELRFDSRFYKKLSIAPFIKFYAIKGRYLLKNANNLFVGFSLSFGHIFVDATKKRQEMAPSY